MFYEDQDTQYHGKIESLLGVASRREWAVKVPALEARKWRPHSNYGNIFPRMHKLEARGKASVQFP